VDIAVLSVESQGRDSRWSEAVAVLEGIKDNLGITAKDRTIEEDSGVSFLKERQISYRNDFSIENDALRGENGHF
jgi:hypothetical protein